MVDQSLLYVGSRLLVLWGAAHLIPTRSVVRGFGDISADNRRIIAVEWIIEGLALIFIGALVAVVTYVDRESNAARVVYWLSVGMLAGLSVVSLMTGARVRFLPFRLCPVIFTTSSLLILIGSFL
jgi:hypothetical protein